MSKKSVSARSAGHPLHGAARLEDAFHAFRLRRALKRKQLPTVVPYTSYGTPSWVRILGRVLMAKDPKPGSRAERKLRGREDSIRGWRSFISVPVTHASVTVSLDGQAYEVTADRGGVIDAVIEVELPIGRHIAKLTVQGSSDRFEAPVIVIDPNVKFGVISDVDDTVMVTALPRPLLAAWNTFVLNEHARVPTPGMAVLLERLATRNAGTPTFYVSTGAWNVAPTLTRFLQRNMFPLGPLLLTDWGPTHDRWFRNGKAHKHSTLRRLAEEFPNTRWVLIGDDGQHDEEIYRQFATEHPGRVAAVAIRQMSPSEALLAGGRSTKLPAPSDVPWVFSPNGAGLADQLERLGILS